MSITVEYPCKNCKERTVEPNCHMTCQRYLECKEVAQSYKEQEQLEQMIQKFVRRKYKKKN